MATATQNLPIESFRVGNVSLAIFENESTTDGRTQKYYRATVDKRYRDNKSGEWKSTSSFSVDELLRLRYLIDQAMAVMISKPTYEPESPSTDRRNR
jgi:hypothetical protein